MYIDNSYILVTGGSGFLGKPLIKRLYESGEKNIRVIARNEGNLVALKQQFPNIDIYIGDMSDPFIAHQAMQNIRGVYHLAASKHVGLAEKFVRETTNSNIIASLNILEESLKSQNVEFIIGISTDKAAQVAGVYGATKLIMERLFNQYQNLNPYCKYRIVRYGNVLYSTGSVLCKWKDLLSKGKSVIVTDLDATRFFWTVDQAIDLIFECLDTCNTPEPYVPKMKGMSLGNLIKAMVIKYYPGYMDDVSSFPIEKIIGLQPGENKHERILENGPMSNEVEQYTVTEIGELI